MYYLRIIVAFLALTVFGSVALAVPVISEFVAKNTAGLVDEDGARGDWIEIHNPTSIAQSMDGWYLTDAVDQKTKWKFPAVTIEPGGFLLVWADGKDRRAPGAPLHTNFSLNSDGEYLALVRPDGITAQQELTFPPQDANRSYGLIFDRTTLVAVGANADYRVPTNATQIAANWKTATATPAGWTLRKPTGLGFGFAVPGMTITVRAMNPANGSLDSQAAAESLLARPSGHADIASETVSVQPTFNVLGEGGDGHYDGSSALPADVLDNYVCRGTGTLTIPTAGVWTFGLNSDDGGRIVIDGLTVMNDDTFHGPEDHVASVTLSAGAHTFEVWFWENGGGDEGEFYAAYGTFTDWDASMVLVGDTANGGLACFTTPLAQVGGGAAQTDVSTAMLGVNPSLFARVPFTASGAGFTSLNLLVRYNDGFSAWLNGTLLASANTPASPGWDSAATAARTNAESLETMAFNITAQLPALVSGANVLAVQGLNASGGDGTFLIEPELVAGRLPASPVAAFFDKPTPGAINSAASSLGKVATLDFSPKRGVYPDAVITTTPFNVALATTTPTAKIRFTTDGTLPTETAGTLYTGPIAVSKTTTLRAIAYLAGWESSKVSTHTYLLPADVITQSPTGGPPNANWPTPDGGFVNGQRIDYGMDPAIVNSTDETIGGAAQVKTALRALPSLSIVLPLHDLFDPTDGIYVNPGGRGLAWERACSLEWLGDPAGSFQQDAGLRIRGGFSRSGDNPKHGFHTFFRKKYGDSTLQFPFFGGSGADTFGQIDFRTAENYAWSFGGDGNNTFLREEFCRQTQLDMGWTGSHPRYCHLYLDGQYWGLYDIDERTEAEHCATYLGGKKADWDVVKAEQDSGYITGATDGNLTAWHLLFEKANPLTAPGTYTRRALTSADYYDMMGLAADGVTRTTSPVLLDADNLIDYMMVTFWTGNLDGATSAFLGEEHANNWFGARDRTGTHGFIFFVHDSEHTLFSVDEDRTGPFVPVFTDQGNYDSKRDNYNPMFLHSDLLDVPEYRQRWHDRVQRHLFNGGALSLAANRDRINRLAATVESAIIAESARWGDEAIDPPRNRNDWRAARDTIINDYLPLRTASVLAQLRADGLYPSVDGVIITPPGGYVSSGAQVNMSGVSAGTIYYTINGADPMRTDGSVDPDAHVFTAAGDFRDTLIADSSAWKYREPSADLGSSDVVAGAGGWSATNWKHPAYDDSATVWKTGSAELGGGDGDEATAIDIGPTDARYPAIYFRKKFTVTDPSQYTALELDLRRDDGAIIYINGQEVGRSNMPGGAIGYDYSGLGAGDETTFFPVQDSRLVPNVLVAGENTIAVEIHQVSATSSDISFDLRLRGVRQTFANPVTLPAGPASVRARAHDGADWGALSEVSFFTEVEPASAANLVVSELHYHPTASSQAENAAGYNDDSFFEYIELMNIGAKNIDLWGVQFTSGIVWTFDASATARRLLAPGERVLIVGNRTAFNLRYGAGRNVAGKFSGTLANSGERLVLRDPSGTVIRDFTYGTLAPWPEEADGFGPALVLKTPLANPDHTNSASWAASAGDSGGFALMADTFAIESNGPNVLDVMANDTAPGGTIKIIGLGTPTHGTVALDAGGIAYTPGPTFVTTDRFTYTAEDGLGHTASAPVMIMNSLMARPGAYASTITLGGVPRGALTFLLSRTRSITGKLVLDGRVFAFKTKLGDDGTLVLHFKRPRLPDLVLSLNVFSLGGFGQTGGLLTDGANAFFIEPHRQLANSLPAGVDAGKFTARLTGGPGGDGYAAFTLNKSSQIKLIGHLGDGTPLTLGTTLRSDSTFTLQRTLYKAPHGYLYGVVSLTRQRGALAWVKPAQQVASSQLFPNGFSASVDFTTSAYAAKTPTLTYTNGHANVTLSGVALTHRISISAQDRITIDAPATDALELKINRTTGVLTGSFKHPAFGKRTAIRGVVFQSGNRADGLFVAPGEAGHFELVPE